MSWFAVGGTVVSAAGSYMQGTEAKKNARRQAALARGQADKLRAHGAEASKASKAEIESMRVLRSLDAPAFRQASEQALIQAKKGSERMQRQRMMGNLPGDVRDAIFGGQFQQYVGREMQSLQKHAALTQQILQATDRQQQLALQVESQANQIETTGQMQALQTEAAAGSQVGSMLGAVGQALGAYGAAKGAKTAAASKSREDLKNRFMTSPAGESSADVFTNGKFDPAKFDVLFPDQSSGWF